MIKIIKGVYGCLDKNGIVKPKTPADAPFELTEEQEARLVRRGVAVYVDAGRTALPENVESVTWDINMKADELRAIAKDMGLTFPVGTTKAAMVAAMDKHIEGTDTVADAADTDDGEAAPTFDAAEAVD